MANPMWEWIDSFPEQLRQAWRLAQNWDLAQLPTPRSLTFLGIGGSAIGADLVTALFRDHLACSVSVVRGEQAPTWLTPQDLVVAISYSGETRETLTAFNQALQAGAPGIVVSSGGTLIQTAKAKHLPFLQIPAGMAPRAALGYTSLPLTRILLSVNALKIVELEVEPAALALERLRAEWSDPAGPAAGIARRMLRRLPLLVGAGWTAVAARRFRGQLAENAKALSMVFELPEALHNLIETLDPVYLETFSPLAVYLEDTESGAFRRQELKVVREAFQTAGVEGLPLLSSGTDPLSRLFTLIHKGDWISYHLARLRGVDPVAIPNITRLKRALSARPPAS